MQPPAADTPAVYPLHVDNGVAEGVVLDEGAYRQASFLDERLLQGGAERVRCAWGALLPAAAPGAHFIFHIGHVGSTLLSRLVGEHERLFAVREPALLRAPVLGASAPSLAEMVRVFSRVWQEEQVAVVKATSFVSEIGSALMQASSGGAAVLLAVTPPVYLRTILAGAASPEEARHLAPLRQARLERRLGRPLRVTSLGEAVAMSWLCETLCLVAIAEAAPDRCLWLDFEQMLAEPQDTLTRVFDHFDAPLDPASIAALAHGPLTTRYAKAPEHGYDAALRREVLERAGREQAAEVRAGMDWLGGLMREHAQVRQALERSAAMSRKLDPVGRG